MKVLLMFSLHSLEIERFCVKNGVESYLMQISRESVQRIFRTIYLIFSPTVLIYFQIPFQMAIEVEREEDEGGMSGETFTDYVSVKMLKLHLKHWCCSPFFFS